MANFDENVNLKQGSDTGQADAASIQPIGPAEVVWGGTDNRPLENLRARTEILRRYMQNVLYYLDYDRCLIIRSNAAFTLTEPTPGNFELSMVGDDLWIYPSLTPGPNSGGRVRGGRVFVAGLPYSGTPLVNDLILTASAQYTGQRGYFDADDFATANSLTLGANRIAVDLIADPALATNVFSFVVAQAPKTKITIRYGTNGGTTTLAALIAAINADLTSQGTYGVANFLRATTTAGAPGAVFPAPFTNGAVQGAYDAETHQVTAAQLAAFFAATEGGVQVNRLKEGEGLAIGYPKGPVESGVPTPRGGRRQSIWDLPTDRIGGLTTNITPLVGWSLFATGREPEKIPGAVPIGKLVNAEFVFVDGTRIGVGETIRLGESRVLRAALASTVFGSSGAALVGYDGSGFWNADAGASPNPNIPAGTVEASLDAVVAHLAPTAAGNSGARRVGVESVAGSVTVGNVALARSAGSLRQALDSALNAAGSETTSGGINARVSEWGHRLKGRVPVEKVFQDAGPTGGARMFQAELNASAVADAIENDDWQFDQAATWLQSFAYDLGGADDSLAASEDVDHDVGAANNEVHFTAMNLARATVLATITTVLSNADEFGNPVYVGICKLRDTVAGPSGDGNGWYYFGKVNPANRRIPLVKLDGTFPDFTGLTPGKAEFFQTTILGSDKSGHRLRVFQGNTTAAWGQFNSIDGDNPLFIGYDTDNVLVGPSFEMSWKRLVFKRLNTNGGVSVARSTDHILIDDDFKKLNGVERGLPGAPLPIDASITHHHGSKYTRLLIPATPVPVLWNTANVLGLTLNNAPDFFKATSISGLIPAGYQVVAAIVEFRLEVSSTGAAAGTLYQVDVLGNPGTVLDGTRQHVIALHSAYKTAGAVETPLSIRQVTIPTNTAGQIYAAVNGALAVTLAACTLYATIHGLWLVPT